MRRSPAAVVSSLFFAAGPGTVTGLVPYWINGWQVHDPLPGAAMLPIRVLGAVLVLAGGVVVAGAFLKFVVEGFGTPIPVAAPDRLVVGGFYRYVRNPMYVAIFAAIVGQAMVFGDPWLLVYAAVMAIPVVSFVRWYEEPELRRRFGAEYDDYRSHVPGWWPRFHPYQR
ncbi:methyltransferase family protein [Nonomuraea diastatica]|uniref:Isoprenylcysteine carboxylmethyltransferase family protein n=1 Tax=Nonomuraea diastatica TaxID=1848329 RepID=A0A4R4WMW8_9ACTN|nr:isoprenylcysteine carboxylmethyltransferase family protein [Nonomuraea diastatica]TDD17913.1 isoprenylcysteine carboxylmethyltransferase family protein [Nonomuraea diastatica]